MAKAAWVGAIWLKRPTHSGGVFGGGPSALAAACCFEDMSCVDMTRQQCFEAGGWPHEPGSSCASIECHGPVPTACCMPDESCVELQPRICSREGGQPHYAQGGCEVVGCTEGCGRVPVDLLWGGTPLTVEKAEDGDIILQWGASCLITDENYVVYEGILGSFYSHEDRFCTTNGQLTKTFAPRSEDAYYLVVPRDSGREGSYGLDDIGFERPQGVSACFQQLIGTCGLVPSVPELRGGDADGADNSCQPERPRPWR